MAHSHIDFDARAIGAAQALEGYHVKNLYNTTEENGMKYEYWYNWDYARAHNPKLMHIGTSGGFGLTRRNMLEYVTQGNKEWAERCFWKLVKESREEWLTEFVFTDEVEQEWDKWLTQVVEEDADDDLWGGLRHFIRCVPAQPPMKDTILDLYPDPMCIVTTQHPDLYLKQGNTYAQELRDFIEWMHESEAGNPMDPGAIY